MFAEIGMNRDQEVRGTIAIGSRPRLMIKRHKNTDFVSPLSPSISPEPQLELKSVLAMLFFGVRCRDGSLRWATVCQRPRLTGRVGGLHGFLFLPFP